MSQFTGMTFEQAMLRIACHDVYLKWQEGTKEQWFDIAESCHRASFLGTHHTSLHTTNRRDWHAYRNALVSLASNKPFHNVEHGTREWFVHLGFALLCIGTGTLWLENSRLVSDNMDYILHNIDDPIFTESLRDCIHMGFTRLSICDECGEYCGTTYEVYDERSICASCRDAYYSYDNYHNIWFHASDACQAMGPQGQDWIINSEDDCSDFLWDDESEQYIHRAYHDGPFGSVIRGYHAHRDDDFVLINSPWTKANKRHFGVELEVECPRGDRNGTAKNIKKWFDTNRDENEQLLYEEDGSLSCGFEMITNPMGLDKHREIWKWLEQKELVAPLRSHNTSTCGLHVHVSKAGLSNLTISKAVCFVNNPSNEALIKAIARRYGSGYCRAKHVTIGKGAKCGDKYEMINLGKRHTMEFRIFRGTLNYSAIQAAIEFTNAVINFSASTSVEELSELNFLKFIYKLEQRMDTKFLRNYLEQRSARIKDIIDRNIKPLYNLRVIKPEPVAIVPDEPAQTPPPRERGSRLENVSYPEDIVPVNVNMMARHDLRDMALENYVRTVVNGRWPQLSTGEQVSLPTAA